MQKTCIVTDSTAVFTKPNLPGREHLYILNHQIQIGEELFEDSTNIQIFNDFNDTNLYPLVLPLSVELFREKFLQLAEDYQDIVVILLSSHLNPSINNARDAVTKLKSPAPIHIIDSQTTATGLGLLVQAALQACTSGLTGVEIHRIVRGLVRHIYAIFCLPDLLYLHRSGFLDPAQAMVGEMLNITPFYILESGNLIPVLKSRSSRHMVDILQEFIAEFDYLKLINLIYGLPAFENECRNLKERISQYFPNVTFGEYKVGTALASILGPNCLGLVALDKGVRVFVD